jgi:hypothetical protein
MILETGSPRAIALVFGSVFTGDDGGRKNAGRVAHFGMVCRGEKNIGIQAFVEFATHWQKKSHPATEQSGP